MGLLDNLSKTISQVGDRAKFEADKFQRTTKLQSEINELKRQIDGNRIEFGDRAIQLYRAGQIQSPTLGELLKALDALQGNITVKEEELKRAQAEVFVEPPAQAAPPVAQNVPISTEPPTADSPARTAMAPPSPTLPLPARTLTLPPAPSLASPLISERAASATSSLGGSKRFREPCPFREVRAEERPLMKASRPSARVREASAR